MKISILGTNGFLSTAIAQYANEAGWNLDMYGLDEPTAHKFDNFYKVNLMDAELDCSGLLTSDIIVYAIGAGIQSNLKEGNDLIYNLNIIVPVRICNALKAAGYQGKFITFGSIFEMGETTEERFFTEEDIQTSLAVAPNDYTVSKRMLTRFISSYKHEFTHWHFIIPTIYGESENPKRLIPYTINAIKNGEELHFTAGDQTRQYIHVSEVPRIIDMAYKKNIPSGIYNIQGKETITVKEIVTLIHKVLGKQVAEGCFGSAQRADVGMKYLALDGSKLKSAINFVATIRLEDIIKKY
ncbi:NAD-dependent epimerase/dehydratase family protein [Segatella copri]|uniref:NAD-dependent epimerase/dehydratase family protein n=1 Tax=Segatella copri TaxID=165179 RepID=UPI003F898C88